MMVVSEASASGVTLVAGDAGGFWLRGRAHIPLLPPHTGVRPLAETPTTMSLRVGTAGGRLSALTDLGRVLVDVRRRGKCFGAAGHDVLHLRGARSKNVGGHSLASSDEMRPLDPAPHVNQPAAVAQGARDRIDHNGNFRQGLLDGGRDLAVLMVNNADNLESALCVETLGGGIGTLSGRHGQLAMRAKRARLFSGFSSETLSGFSSEICSFIVRVAIIRFRDTFSYTRPLLLQMHQNAGKRGARNTPGAPGPMPRSPTTRLKGSFAEDA